MKLWVSWSPLELGYAQNGKYVCQQHMKWTREFDKAASLPKILSKQAENWLKHMGYSFDWAWLPDREEKTQVYDFIPGRQKPPLLLSFALDDLEKIEKTFFDFWLSLSNHIFSF